MRTVGSEKNTAERARERGPSEEIPSDWKSEIINLINMIIIYRVVKSELLLKLKMC